MKLHRIYTCIISILIFTNSIVSYSSDKNKYPDLTGILQISSKAFHQKPRQPQVQFLLRKKTKKNVTTTCKYFFKWQLAQQKQAFRAVQADLQKTHKENSDLKKEIARLHHENKKHIEIIDAHRKEIYDLRYELDHTASAIAIGDMPMCASLPVQRSVKDEVSDDEIDSGDPHILL